MTHGEIRANKQEHWMLPLTGASVKELKQILQFISFELDQEAPNVQAIKRTITTTLAETKHKLCCACAGTGVQS